jgi:hypothetical protein
MPIFAATVFLSAFLLFAVQPMVAKFLLPSFGGAAAVWSTCLVFFQLLLLAGYAYAHFLRTKLSPIAQRWTHLGVLAISLVFLPPVPSVHPLADPSATPIWELLRSLTVSLAIPFFALSATAPLLMEWFRQSHPNKSAHRLYAFSNAGSLLALLAYPAFLEPEFTRTNQARLWSAGLVIFLLACALVAWRSRQPAMLAPSADLSEPAPQSKIKNQKSKITWLWLALPACSTGLLLALTNQLSQDVTPMPLLWVAPMAVYLLTFILCFEGPRSYKRGLFIPAAFASFLLLAWLLDQGYLQGFWLQVGGYLTILFLGCMLCHGELYRLRPENQHLTAYYLALSAGGALGGIFVALAAPVLFRTLLETPILIVAIACLTTVILWREKTQWSYRLVSPTSAALTGTILIALSLGFVLHDLRRESIYFTRSFYGAYRVKEGPTLLLDGTDYPLTPGPARVLYSGQIYHGLQFLDPEAARIPTTYYCEEEGLGVAFRELPAATNRNIGAIGLGAGTLAAYGKPGDHIRFYELNPDVLRVARAYFTFLRNSSADVDVVLGDGRLSLQREQNQNLDLLVLDAFAGDSIPVHLLTEEAMRVYQRHLKPDGVMAFHISNSHLDLEPVVRALAGKCGLQAVLVPPSLVDPKDGKLPSVWMLLSANADFFRRPAIQQLLAFSSTPPRRQPILWTDDYSSILPILH